jgi:plasmid maintenance system antidote protein VapI
LFFNIVSLKANFRKLCISKRGITPDTALRLEKLFGMDAQFWLNLQLSWDLYHATRSLAAKEIKKIKRLPALAHVQAVSVQINAIDQNS